jgi:hypothetical protein
MSEPTPETVSPADVVAQLRSGTGDLPLPPPPPPPWYFRTPVRAAAWLVTVVTCLWAGWVWHDHRTCEVSGRVFDFRGRPIAGAVVRIEGYDPAAVSDDAGMFLLQYRPAGEAWVLVEVPGSGGVAYPIVPVRGEAIDIGRLSLYTTD